VLYRLVKKDDLWYFVNETTKFQHLSLPIQCEDVETLLYRLMYRGHVSGIRRMLSGKVITADEHDALEEQEQRQVVVYVQSQWDHRTLSGLAKAVLSYKKLHKPRNRASYKFEKPKSKKAVQADWSY
jgi:hypothetical protein